MCHGIHVQKEESISFWIKQILPAMGISFFVRMSKLQPLLKMEEKVTNYLVFLQYMNSLPLVQLIKVVSKCLCEIKAKN